MIKFDIKAFIIHFDVKAGLALLLIGGLLSFFLFYFNVLNTFYTLSKTRSAFLFGISVAIGLFIAAMLFRYISNGYNGETAFKIEQEGLNSLLCNPVNICS